MGWATFDSSAEKLAGVPEPSLRTQALLALIRERDSELFADAKTQQWLARIRVVADFLGLEANAWLTENLLADLEHWATPYVTLLASRAEALAWHPLPALKEQLHSYAQQQQLEELMPTRWQAPSGRSHAVTYQQDGSALIALKLQEVFGTPNSPEFAKGRLKPTF